VADVSRRGVSAFAQGTRIPRTDVTGFLSRPSATSA
jgi:hypothetical protein